MQVGKDVERIAQYLEDNARNPEDNQAAFYLRRLMRVYSAAYEMMHAKTHAHSSAAYSEMLDLMRGKTE